MLKTIIEELLKLESQIFYPGLIVIIFIWILVAVGINVILGNKVNQLKIWLTQVRVTNKVVAVLIFITATMAYFKDYNAMWVLTGALMCIWALTKWYISIRSEELRRYR